MNIDQRMSHLLLDYAFTHDLAIHSDDPVSFLQELFNQFSLKVRDFQKLMSNFDLN